MKVLAFIAISLLSLSSFANQSCITVQQARETAMVQQNELFTQILNKYHLKECRGSRRTQDCLAISDLALRIANINYSDFAKAFTSPYVYSFTDAPGAQTWVHVIVTCSGAVDLIEFGD